LRFDLSAGDSTDSFVEIWYRAQPGVGALEVRVRTPGRDWSGWVGAGDECSLSGPSGQGVVAMLRHDTRVPNGSKALMLLAIAPTAATEQAPGATAEAGIWDIEVRLVSSASAAAGPSATEGIDIGAWIERDDPSDRDSGVASAFVGLDDEDEYDTLSSLATGRQTIVAGGFRQSDQRPAIYSSLPAKGRYPRLFALASCEQDEDFPSVRAAAVRSTEVFRMNGTSVAAPALARRLFNLMVGARAPVKRSDWRRLLARLFIEDPGHVMPPPQP
jgi:hypothetical protein